MILSMNYSVKISQHRGQKLDESSACWSISVKIVRIRQNKEQKQAYKVEIPPFIKQKLPPDFACLTIGVADESKGRLTIVL